jgi:hypothetical protein
MGYHSDIAFTPSVKAAQEARGSRGGYDKAMARHDWGDRVTPALAGFIAERDSFYLGTASADGQPYIQHRGGPRGFFGSTSRLGTSTRTTRRSCS